MCPPFLLPATLSLRVRACSSYAIVFNQHFLACVAHSNLLRSTAFLHSRELSSPDGEAPCYLTHSPCSHIPAFLHMSTALGSVALYCCIAVGNRSGIHAACGRALVMAVSNGRSQAAGGSTALA